MQNNYRDAEWRPVNAKVTVYDAVWLDTFLFWRRYLCS